MESKYKRAFCKYVLHWPYSKINTLSSSCRWLRKIRPKIFISAKSKICTTNRFKKKKKNERYTTQGSLSNKKQSSFKEHGLGSRKLLIFTFLIFNFLTLIKRNSWGKQKPENFYQKGIGEAQIFIEIENLSLQKLKIDLQHGRCKEKLSPEALLDSPGKVLLILKVLRLTFAHLSAIWE